MCVAGNGRFPYNFAISIILDGISLLRLRLLIPFLFLLLLAGCTAEPPPPTPTLPPELARGQRVFQIQCASCHSLQDDLVIVGPSLAGIAGRAETRIDGQDARAYLYTAILDPNAFTVPGFSQLMPTTFGKTISGEDLDALVAFLLTMK